MEMRIHLDGRKRVSAQYGAFTVHTDQPVEAGGEASAPAPFDLFLASIGTCAGYFVQTFCQTRNIPTDGIEIVQHTEQDPAKHLVSKIRLEIIVPETFPAKYRAGLVNAANLCTVKRHLQTPPVFDVETQVAPSAAVQGAA